MHTRWPEMRAPSRWQVVGRFAWRLVWAPFCAVLIVIAPVLIVALSLITILGLLSIAFYVGLVKLPGFPWGIVLAISTSSAMLAVTLQELVRQLGRR
ncbi:MAG: hypothetical protein CMLOHMNK_01837 [Steroidobacteraceae bacterium]|nr:hypothetical protein [Steroidobacteraceae bacterium]